MTTSYQGTYPVIFPPTRKEVLPVFVTASGLPYAKHRGERLPVQWNGEKRAYEIVSRLAPTHKPIVIEFTSAPVQFTYWGYYDTVTKVEHLDDGRVKITVTMEPDYDASGESWRIK